MDNDPHWEDDPNGKMIHPRMWYNREDHLHLNGGDPHGVMIHILLGWQSTLAEHSPRGAKLNVELSCRMFCVRVVAIHIHKMLLYLINLMNNIILNEMLLY